MSTTSKTQKLTRRAWALIRHHSMAELEWLLDECAAAERRAARLAEDDGAFDPKPAKSRTGAPWRAQRRARNIRRRLGADGNALDAPFPPKPRRMRWATYEHLRARDDALQQRWLAGAMAAVDRLTGRLNRP
jgi:hypothetical protein